MIKKRIMLLGANGQVGQALRAASLPDDWQLGPFGHAECDITNHSQVQAVIHQFKPDVVINSAAMTAVDKCETEQEQAVAANFEAPANLAAQCVTRDIPLIHLSTDYVFDGKETTPYTTEDLLNPLSFYGHSKMMGEEAVRHTHPFHVILRISSVFSAYGTNLLTKMLGNIDTRDEIKAVTDQTSGPTPAQDVANALIAISSAILDGKSGGFGTFHLCGGPAVTRFEFSKTIIDAYTPYTDKRPKLSPARSSDFPGFAERPHYSVLDCTRIETVYGIKQRIWTDGLAEAMQILMRDRKRVA